MVELSDYKSSDPITWCPGCGDFFILDALKQALVELNLKPENILLVSGIGQASPTSDENMSTGTTPKGVFIPPEKPLVLAVASDCSLVARGYAGDKTHLTYLIKEAIKNKGFSLVDILQPCVSFNKINTYKWYKDRVYKVEDGIYDPYNKTDAFNKVLEWGEKIPIGIIYRSLRKSYEEITGLEGEKPLIERDSNKNKMEQLYKDFY
ncbi:MAG: hypothetical protein AUJ85_08440 [Elusimicrobia bacterium CG1_02_37_114]|nr:MAG: hypothetical protein AUJ85_08440 [Elusimicrobia bacterium CG1_02_37_114]PIV53975.1 MAG: hypothetical protein COS17_01085 [Elusimicrobia bacterium CG02_land_8_20_14_3_00_37_13]PIZ13009.1 MAG: hypothetical protein COY53_07140 [Elusimicrobia bacterium CG_4_10_14_0_8_um_filter_37_32]